MVIAIVVVLLAAASICCGTLVMLRSEPEAGRPPYTRTEKVLLFLAGFVGWPFALAFLIFIGLFFWDMLLYEDVLKELGEKISD